MLIVGSGNLTYNGYALNEEVWNAFSISGEGGVSKPLFRAAWEYIVGLNLPCSLLLKRQLGWMRENARWLAEIPDTEPERAIIDNEEFLFLANDYAGSIFDKLKKIIGRERVQSITTISPFYDISGLTLTRLNEDFRPDEIRSVYSEEGTYPYELMIDRPEWLKLYSWASQTVMNTGRLHTKIIQFRLPTRTVFVSGSANITNAAFGGSGDEACIAIIARPDRNFVSELGIVLDNNSEVGKSVVDTLPKPQRAESASYSNSIEIILAEVVDDTLDVSLKIRNFQDCYLRILDLKGQRLADYDIQSDVRLLQIGGFTLTECMAVVVDPTEKEISNRCLIINESDVAWLNPNRILRKLDSLLESGRGWKENLSGILSYLWFDDEPDTKPVRRTATVAKAEKGSDGNLVTGEEFDNIRVGSRQSVLSLPDVRIIDFLLSSESRRDANDTPDNPDDTDAVGDIDDGNNEYRNSEYTVRQRERESDFINCIERYGQRLNRHYDIRLSRLYSAANNPATNIFHSGFGDDITIGVRDFSHILIEVVLVCRELKNCSDPRYRTIRKDFVRCLGKFLLLAQKGYNRTNDYGWHKCVEFHTELIVFSLLTIATQKWNRTETTTVKLLVLNLLDSCTGSDSIDFQRVKDLYVKKTGESDIAPVAHSIALIERTISEYERFLDLKNDPSTVSDVDLDNPDRNYSYRKGYGFFYVTEVQPVYQSRTGTVAFEMSLRNPGFDDIVRIRGGRKIRCLIPAEESL
ncbi:MAG: hypothetical protein NC336_07060 [Clostridium sp.]|nr:hypothetical protein [Clostridium sp.]